MSRRVRPEKKDSRLMRREKSAHSPADLGDVARDPIAEWGGVQHAEKVTGVANIVQRGLGHAHWGERHARPVCARLANAYAEGLPLDAIC